MPIEAKFHVEPQSDGLMKVSTNGLCHMHKDSTNFCSNNDPG